MIFISSYFIGM